MPDTLAVLTEKMRVIEREVRDLKKDFKEADGDVDELASQMKLVVYKLEAIEKTVASINTTLSKDTGWRGFFIDFIKAAAQIAALVGAGKFIF
jgi:septal ring factor EnvC (AmiA/AmiB activator)